MSIETNKAVVRRFYERVIDGQDFDAIDDLMAEDFRSVDDLAGEASGDRSEFERAMERVREGCPDFGRIFESDLGGHWKLMSYRECTCTTATILTCTTDEMPSFVVLRSECASCERTRLWSRLMIRLNVPSDEAMEIAWSCPAERLAGISRLLDYEDSKRSYERLRECMERAEMAS